MRCLYCGKRVALFRKLTGGGEFCSEPHRRKFQEEYNQIALTRLLPANEAAPEPGVPESSLSVAPNKDEIRSSIEAAVRSPDSLSVPSIAREDAAAEPNSLGIEPDGSGGAPIPGAAEPPNTREPPPPAAMKKLCFPLIDSPEPVLHCVGVLPLQFAPAYRQTAAAFLEPSNENSGSGGLPPSEPPRNQIEQHSAFGRERTDTAPVEPPPARMLASGAEPGPQSVMLADSPAEDAPHPSEAQIAVVTAAPEPISDNVRALGEATQEPPPQHGEIPERSGSSDAAADAAPEPAGICEGTAERDSEAQPQMQFQLTSIDLGRRSAGLRWATIVIAVAVALFGIAYLLQANPASTLTGTMEWPLRGADPVFRIISAADLAAGHRIHTAVSESSEMRVCTPARRLQVGAGAHS